MGGENRVEAMRQYVRQCLEDGDNPDFVSVLSRIDLDGLGEIIGVIGEAYTNFQEKS